MNYWLERNLIRYVVEGLQKGLWSIHDWEIGIDGSRAILFNLKDAEAFRITTEGAKEIVRRIL